MQPRFESRAGRGPFRLISHPRFRAAYDFMLLRAESGETSAESASWWKDFLSASQEQRDKMVQSLSSPTKKRRKRNRRKSASNKIDVSEKTAS